MTFALNRMILFMTGSAAKHPKKPYCHFVHGGLLMNNLNLACFLSVSRTLNFSVSAEILCIPQQSVSRNIQRLEEELGYALLNRGSQTVTLTYEGREFCRWCNSLDQRLRSADMALKRVPASLGLGWGDWTGCPDVMEKAIRAFQMQHPMVELHVTQGTHQEVMQYLDTDLIDLALLPTRCVGSAAGLQLDDAGIALPLYVLIGADNPLRTLNGPKSAMLAALPQLTPPLLCDRTRGSRPLALSDLFSCDFPHGAIQPMPNVDSCYLGLLGNTGCTISPINGMIAEQDWLAVLCPAGNSAELTFLRKVNGQSPWCSIFIQLFREAAAA